VAKQKTVDADVMAPTVRQTTKAFQHGFLDALAGYRTNVAALLPEDACRDALVRTIYDLVELERLDAARIDRQLRAKEKTPVVEGAPLTVLAPPGLLDHLCTRVDMLEEALAALGTALTVSPPPKPPARASRKRRAKR
jgi:hypothetical protein